MPESEALTTGAEATDAAPVVPATNAVDTSELVHVGVDALIVGRRLNSPIYDTVGTLLAAAGTQITSKMKKQLRDRNLHEVSIHADDVSRVTLDASSLDIEPPTLAIDSKVIKEVDSMIADGGLFVANTGAALRDQMVFNDCKGYDEEEREKLIERHKAVSHELDGMMTDAVRGGTIDGDKLANSTGEYLASMVSDADNVLTVASEVSQDPSLSDHCLQMALLGMAIGIEMGLDEGNVRTIGISGLLHDWGMIRVPAEIRESDRVLTSEEMIPIRRHPTHSLEILQRVTRLSRDVPLVCYQVHERPNGSGYPRQRSHHQIHMFAKILSVADAYVALTSPRKYRPPLTPYAAMECLLKLARHKFFDSDVVRKLLNTLCLFPLNSLVTLSDGGIAQVLRRDGDNYATPIVKRLTDGEGNPPKEEDGPIVIKLSSSDLKVVQALPTPGRDETGCTPQVLVMSQR